MSVPFTAVMIPAINGILFPVIFSGISSAIRKTITADKLPMNICTNLIIIGLFNPPIAKVPAKKYSYSGA